MSFFVVVIGYWLLVIGYWLLVICSPLSPFSLQTHLDARAAY